jgi:hypothetical protein
VPAVVSELGVSVTVVAVVPAAVPEVPLALVTAESSPSPASLDAHADVTSSAAHASATRRGVGEVGLTLGLNMVATYEHRLWARWRPSVSCL